MNPIPPIANAEWTIMQALWHKGPLSAIEVFEYLESDNDWHPKTVRTLLGRLVDKGAVSRKKVGGVYRFSSLVEEKNCVQQESQSFLDRCFGGAPQPMLAHFIEHEDLDNSDIEALRAMLDQRIERGGAQ